MRDCAGLVAYAHWAGGPFVDAGHRFIPPFTQFTHTQSTLGQEHGGGIVHYENNNKIFDDLAWRRSSGASRAGGADEREGGERRIMKTFELLSIIGSIAAVGIALAAVVIGSNANLRTEMRTDIRSLEMRLSAVEQRQARTEGLLEGLRDAVAALERRLPPGESDAT